MNEYEELPEVARNYNVNTIEKYNFNSERIKGLYCDDCIALNSSISTTLSKLIQAHKARLPV